MNKQMYYLKIHGTINYFVFDEELGFCFTDYNSSNKNWQLVPTHLSEDRIKKLNPISLNEMVYKINQFETKDKING